MISGKTGRKQNQKLDPNEEHSDYRIVNKMKQTKTRNGWIFFRSYYK